MRICAEAPLFRRTAEYFDEKLSLGSTMSIYPYGKGVSVYFPRCNRNGGG